MSPTYSRVNHTRSWPIVAGAAALVLIAACIAAVYWWPSGEGDAPAATAPAADVAALEATSLEATQAAAAVAAEAETVAPPAPPATRLRMGTVSGATAVPVSVPLLLEGAQGLASASVRVAYDPSVVVLEGVSNGDVPQSSIAFHHDTAAGILILLLTTSAAEGVSGDHTFAMFTFAAREGAVGTRSALDLTVRGAAAHDGTTLAVGAEGGSFRNGLAGDVSGDGVVDRADYDLLAAFLVGEQVEIVRLNADVDGDGEITDADALRLHQYLDGTRASP